MAEFQEVMRQWVRARKATTSNADEDVLSDSPLAMFDNARIADIEKNVMEWASEHPEPVYPTWYDYLYSIGVLYKELTACGNVTRTNWGYMMAPIPDDIAQRLGLKPKEGA